MQELANESGIEYRQLGRIERGEINTTVLSLRNISKALDIEIAEFFRSPSTKS